MIASDYRLADRVFDVVGDDLVALAEYDRNSVEFQYIGGDVLDSATEKQIKRIHEEMVLEGLSGEFLERSFELGSLRSITLGFEEGKAYNFVRSDSSGVIVLTTPHYCGGETAIDDVIRATESGTA